MAGMAAAIRSEAMSPADRRPADRLMSSSLTAVPPPQRCSPVTIPSSTPRMRSPGPSRIAHPGVGTPGERPVAIGPRRREGDRPHLARHLAVNRWGRVGPAASISKGFIFRPAIGTGVNPLAPLGLFDDLRAPAAAFGRSRLL